MKDNGRLLKNYIRSFLLERQSAQTRKAKAGDWTKAVDQLNDYLKDRNLIFNVTSYAQHGSKATDVQGDLLTKDLNRAVATNVNLEIKSFNSITKFKIEITNPASKTREKMLRDDAALGTSQEVESQLSKKIRTAGGAELSNMVAKALTLTTSTEIPGKYPISGTDKPRAIYVVPGEVNDWRRVRAVGDSGKPRSFYVIPNPMVKAAKKPIISTAEVEQSVQEDFSSGGDDVLMICGPNCSQIRCFSLTQKGFDAFGFPMFASEGQTIESGTEDVGSFGGGGRISAEFILKDTSGVIIPSTQK